MKLIWLVGFRIASDFGCILGPRPPLCLQNGIRSKMKKNQTLNTCRTDLASLDRLLSTRILEGERCHLTMLISAQRILSRAEREKYMPNFHFEEKCMHGSHSRNQAQS